MNPGVAQAEGDGRPSRAQSQVDYRRPRSAFGERDARRLVAEHPFGEGPDSIDEGGDSLDPMLGDYRCYAGLGNQPEHELQHVLGRLWVGGGGWLIEDER